MEENNIPSEFDERVDSILNAEVEKKNKRKNHWWNNMCPCELVCIVGLICCILYLIVIGTLGMIFNW